MAKGSFITERRLSSDANDGTSEEREFAAFAATQRKILEKAFRKGKPTKFPDPEDGNIHMILIDLRDWNLGVTDSWDHWLLGWGNKSLAHLTLDEKLMYSRYLDDDDHSPFIGLFDPELKINGANCFRSRIHLLGFVREEHYEQREIERATLVWNQDLFADQKALSFALKNGPIRPVQSR